MTAREARIHAWTTLAIGAAVSATTWIEIEPASAWVQTRISALHLVHVLRLSSAVALAVALAAGVLDGFASVAARRDRIGRFAAPSALALALLPSALDAAHLLASGDGVARHLAWLVAVAAVAALAGGPVVFWLWSRTRPRSARWAALGFVAWLLLTAAAPRVLASYAFLTPFLLGASTFVGACLLAAALEAIPRACMPAIVLVLASIAGAWLVAVVRPDLGSSARHAFLRAEASTTQLDVLLFGALPARRHASFAPSAAKACACVAPAVRAAATRLPATAHRSVILISIDALRRDAVDWSSGGRPVAPRIARFLSESTTPRHAYTSYPATLFAMAGAASGLSPSRLLLAQEPPATIFRLARDAVDERHVVFPDSGWFRAPAIDSFVRQGANTVFAATAATATDTLIATLTRARAAHRSVLAWIHYGEPHEPYVVHPGFEFGAGLRERYMSEVAFVDHHVGRLLDHLRDTGWRDDSLVIVFSDHGEALGERGRSGHHVSLNRWLMDIPLSIGLPPDLVRPPHAVASILDVAPTVLEFLGVSPPPYPLDGRSLLAPDAAGARRSIVAEAFPLRGNDLWAFAAAASGTPDAMRRKLERIETASAHYAPKVAMVRDGRRLIVNRASGLAELYDTTSDADEGVDRTQIDAETLRSLLAALGRWRDAQWCHVRCEGTGAR